MMSKECLPVPVLLQFSGIQGDISGIPGFVILLKKLPFCFVVSVLFRPE